MAYAPSERKDTSKESIIYVRCTPERQGLWGMGPLYGITGIVIHKLVIVLFVVSYECHSVFIPIAKAFATFYNNNYSNRGRRTNLVLRGPAPMTGHDASSCRALGHWGIRSCSTGVSTARLWTILRYVKC